MSLKSTIKSRRISLDTMEDLLTEELRDLYDMESVIIEALPKMEKAVTNPQLKEAFREHLDTTRRHKMRLEEVFTMMDMEAEASRCDGIRGIIDEGEVLLKCKGDAAVKDAALIGAAQRVEHYEMAVYGMARSLARQIGRADIEEILQQTLNEEGQSDHWLTDIAESTVNPRAAER